MAEFWLIRHAQASFGAADYDNLSDLGHEQARALGVALRDLGLRPEVVVIGGQRRHRQTWAGINATLGFTADIQVNPGFNEFDFAGLLNARYRGQATPKDLHTDRRKHFTELRACVLEWQRDEIPDPPETYVAFSARVSAARHQAMRSGAGVVLAISSGGPIGQTVADIMQAPADAMIRVQLQTKNCSVSRFIITPRAEHLSSFNETPHITAANADRLMTYS